MLVLAQIPKIRNGKISDKFELHVYIPAESIKVEEEY
jgi:hypothetical protein